MAEVNTIDTNKTNSQENAKFTVWKSISDIVSESVYKNSHTVRRDDSLTCHGRLSVRFWYQVDTIRAGHQNRVGTDDSSTVCCENQRVRNTSLKVMCDLKLTITTAIIITSYPVRIRIRLIKSTTIEIAVRVFTAQARQLVVTSCADDDFNCLVVSVGSRIG